jgi:hypothetical protein
MDDDKKMVSQTRDDGEYVEEKDLDLQVDKEGNPIDPIELNQSIEGFEEDQSGQETLRNAIKDDTAHNDE